MNVMVKVTGGHWLNFQGCLTWEAWRGVEPGPVGIYPVPELLGRLPVWAGGWDASDSGSFLLACFPTQPFLPRGEGNGRAEEGGLTRPSVQPGLGTLPKAPKTMPGMEAGPGQRQVRGGA